MLITVDKLSINFNEDEEEMEHRLEELKKLEKAIEDSTHFKLLAGKTQMISRGKGMVKKERSRIQHTRAIATLVVKPQIEQIYDRILKENPIYQTSEKHKRIFELNRQIALVRGMCMAKAHDIGHVPFGHEGEKAINDFFSDIKSPEDVESVLTEHLNYFGRSYEEKQGHLDEELVDELFPASVDKQLSFEHNELSGILLNQIIQANGIDIPESERLALTLGVLGHSTSRTPFDLLRSDIVAQIVRVADKVEYINFDYDEIADLIQMDTKKFSREQLEYIRKTSPERIAETNKALVAEAFSTGKIYEKNPTMKRLTDIRKGYDDLIYLYDGIYADGLLKNLLAISDSPEKLDEFYKTHPGVEAMYSRDTLEMFKKCRKMYADSRVQPSSVTKLDLDSAYNRMTTEQVHFKGVLQGENSDRISLITDRILRYYYDHQDEIPSEVTRDVTPIDFIKPAHITYTLNSQYSPIQRTLEYVSLMDDQELMNQYRSLVERRIEEGEGHGIKPISMFEVKQYLRTAYEQEVEKYRRSRATDDDVDYNFLEARNKYKRKSREYFDTRLTTRGKQALAQSYEERFSEYAEDYALCRRMEERDAERKKAERKEEVVETARQIKAGERSAKVTRAPIITIGRKRSRYTDKGPFKAVKGLLDGIDRKRKSSHIDISKSETRKRPTNPSNPTTPNGPGSSGDGQERDR